jgi:hypothetical protein
MSKRDDLLREILHDNELMEKYKLKEKNIKEIRCVPPFYDKIVDVLATIINENADGRSSRQIYNTIKNSIHKI